MSSRRGQRPCSGMGKDYEVQCGCQLAGWERWLTLGLARSLAMRPVGGIGAQCEGSLGELDLFAGLLGGGKQGIVRDGIGAPSPADTVFAGCSRHAAAGNAQALSTLGPVAGRSCK